MYWKNRLSDKYQAAVCDSKGWSSCVVCGSLDSTSSTPGTSRNSLVASSTAEPQVLHPQPARGKPRLKKKKKSLEEEGRSISEMATVLSRTQGVSSAGTRAHPFAVGRSIDELSFLESNWQDENRIHRGRFLCLNTVFSEFRINSQVLIILKNVHWNTVCAKNLKDPRSNIQYQK